MFALLLAAGGATSGPTDVIQTQHGPVQGKEGEFGRSFLGIRYAAPPERWTPPQAPAPWKEVQQVVKDAPGCIQNCTLPAGCPDQISEDCLFLNVQTPPKSAKGPFPVFVFIHGGGFRVGCGSGAMINADYIAGKKDIVYVSMNYRLGVLGFLTTLTGGVDGNFGILDQRLALQWVKTNIAAFGGDPTRITLAGESAGGQSVSIHMIEPASQGLFHQAIIQSNPWGSPLKALNDGKKIAADWAAQVKCATSDIACMRNVTPMEVLRAQAACETKITDQHFLELMEPWGPVLGTPTISLNRQVIEYFGAGEFAQIPLMIGTTADEAILFIYSAFTSLSKLAAESLALAIFKPAAGKKVIDKYAIGKITGDARANMSVIATDFTFLCSSRYAARHNKANTFLYLYDYVTVVGPTVWGPDYKYCWDVVCHGAEVPIVLHTGERLAKVPDYELLIEGNVSGYWSNFVHSGNPNQGNTPGLAPWPQYTAAADPIMLLRAQQTVGYKFRESYCDFWDDLGYVF